jgi:hypothetical protein
MAKSRRQRVAERAGFRCKYCHIPESQDALPFQLDHVRARKHAGPTLLGNLAYSCLACNSFKGPNIAGFDDESESIHRLFDPRHDRWSDHFEWDGPFLLGNTAIGRMTVDVMRINQLARVEHRRLLMLGGEMRME